MNGLSFRVLPAALLAGILVSAPMGGGTAGAADPLSAPRTAVHAAQAGPGARLWAKLFRGVGDRGAEARAMAVSPDGKTVFVTGSSWGGKATGIDYATVAYRAATGARLWVARYHGPGAKEDTPAAVAVSPDGSTVFVTGYSSLHYHFGPRADYATVAYRAATGAQVWVKRYSFAKGSGNFPRSVAVSPDGAMVFVTGRSAPTTARSSDYATVAYRAGTGSQLWVRRYNGPANGLDAANAVAVSTSGSTVFVTGDSIGRGTRQDYATVAYRATTGARLWVARYNGPGNGDDAARALAVSGAVVFVAGSSRGLTEGSDFATIAYRAGTGAKLWTARYNKSGYDEVSAMAVNGDGSMLFVTGGSGPGEPPSQFDFATVAYRTATGARLWAASYNGPANGYDQGRSVAVSPNGKTVFVTGESMGIAGYNFATLAYRAATGDPLWVRRYNPGQFPCSVAVSPHGSKVFVTGGGNGGVDERGGYFATVAYQS